MTGRNNKPDNDGPASQPGRLDQFGDKLAEETVSNEAEACETGDRIDHQAE